MEANGFRDAKPQFQDVQVIGVSPDPIAKQKKFDQKYGLSYPLLSDREHALAEACGIWVQKSFMGKKYMGVERTTYLVDENGVVQQIWRKVKPQGHAQEVLALI